MKALNELYDWLLSEAWPGAHPPSPFGLSTTAMQLRPMHLPLELWFLIAALLDRPTLKSLSLVSSTHRDAVRPVLFSHLRLGHNKTYEPSIHEMLTRNEGLVARCVRRLDLVGPTINVPGYPLVSVDVLASMRNLRSLSILNDPFQNETQFRESVEALKEGCTSLTSVTFDVSSKEFTYNTPMALHRIERITWRGRDFDQANPFVSSAFLSLATASSNTITHLSLLSTLKSVEAKHFASFSGTYFFPALKSLRLEFWNAFGVRIVSAIGKFLNAHHTIEDLQLGWGRVSGFRGFEWDLPEVDPEGFLPNLQSLDAHPIHLTFFATSYPSSLRNLKNLCLGVGDRTDSRCVIDMLEALKTIGGIPKLKRLVFDAWYHLYDKNFVSMMNEFAVLSPRLEFWEAQFEDPLALSDITDILSKFPDLRDAYLDGRCMEHSHIIHVAVTVANVCPKFERFAAYAVHNKDACEANLQDCIAHIQRGETGLFSTELRVEKRKGLWSFV